MINMAPYFLDFLFVICPFACDGRKRVFGWARSHNSEFFMLQETHKIYSDSWNTEWTGQSLWAHGSNFSRGCAILVKPNSEFKIVNSRTDVDGRYILANLKNCGSWLTLVCVYAPDTPGSRPDLFESLKTAIVDFSPKGPLIVGGDFNVVLDPAKDWLGKPLLQFVYGRRELSEMLDLFELTDPFCAGENPCENFTWSNKTGTTRSRLDRFQSTLEKVMVSHLAFLNSDHRPVLLQFQTGRWERGQGYWKLNTFVLGELGYRVRVEGALAVSELRKNHVQLDEWWDGTKARFAEVSKTYCKQRARRTRSLVCLLYTSPSPRDS